MLFFSQSPPNVELEDQPQTTTADEDFEDEIKKLVKKKRLVFVTAGKSGAGKSTLINNLLELKGKKAAESKASPNSVTKAVDYYEEEIHGVKVRIIDTPGFEARDLTSKEEQETLPVLSALTDGKADIMLYCMKLSDRADEKDERIVKKLTKAFGEEIWRHTVLVLTFGDAMLNENEGDQDILERFTNEFQEVLKKAGVNDVPVKSILSAQDAGSELESVQQPKIIGVPVGKRTESPQDWRDLLFKEIIKKCKKNSIPAMLMLQGMTPDWVEAVLVLGGAVGMGAGWLGGGVAGGAAGAVAGATAGATAGGSIGGVVGGVVGGAVGTVFGGIGAIPGAAIGATIGEGIGAVTGAVTGGVTGVVTVGGAGVAAAAYTMYGTARLSDKLFSYVAIIRARKTVEELEKKKASEKEEMKAIEEEKANVQEMATSTKEGNEQEKKAIEKATEAEESTNEKEMANEEK